MILALLLAAAAPAPMTAIDAERAFAADAQKNGQWTAFRKWSTADALMFVPQPVNARAYLAKLRNPPLSVYWWPGRSYVSCDGTVAVNTGPWVRNYGKGIGYFTTVWVRQKDGGWKWVYDAGDEEKFARGEGGDIAPVIAPCSKYQLPPNGLDEVPEGAKYGRGSSKDGSLQWEWTAFRDGRRHFSTLQWDGKKFQTVIDDKAAATPPR